MTYEPDLCLQPRFLQSCDPWTRAEWYRYVDGEMTAEEAADYEENANDKLFNEN